MFYKRERTNQHKRNEKPSSPSLKVEDGRHQSSENKIPVSSLNNSDRHRTLLAEQEVVAPSSENQGKRPAYPSSPSDVLSIRGYHRRVRFYSTAPVSQRIDPLAEIRQIAVELECADWSRELQERVSSLGSVSFKTDSYFVQTKDSRDCVREFFKFLIQRKEILKEIEKCIQSKQKFLSNGEEDVWPGCISFVTSMLDDKSVCFVALSRDANGSDTKLLKLLDELAKDLNLGQRGRQGKYCYAVVMETSRSFKTIMQGLTGKTRTCAEYDFGSLLSKLYVEYGKRLKVEGCSNAFLFHYEQETEIQYKKDMRGRTMTNVTVRDTYNSSVRRRAGNTEISIVGGQKVTLIPCCSVCQHNKSNFFAVLISFQEEGEKFRQIQRESDILQETEVASEQSSASEKKSKRLSTGITGLKGNSMNSFLTNVSPSLMMKQEEDDESQEILVYS
ncbi:hypothetical protein [Legionella micdadei]|uniref:Uncharacterized protein n=1 Tax=Legionella micdadei TaxID=451 RepID=A0A098GE23_LEGMI|nr:hypothetical protein [Legionella micdadei]ARG97704.1 hypothetical protein B6N58_08535 [Legionella micdadei]ARG99982.1 hypothetical protein B6V88_05880 [Legionella micdadei]KTD27800.1 hypothetical protein Lmic_2120 [Legionella micdadei]NSL17783.1 hypothetical protein [Legionella micdadei]CEG60713.1 protein of unknown function [Legionella micdadei]